MNEEKIIIEEKASPKHVFLHLFVITMLYFSTINLLILIFQLTNFVITDSLASFYQTGLIRFAIASLIIVFPVFVLTSRYLNNNYKKNKAIREMRTRKWLIYFTLFVSALLIIGDLIGLILVFLEGEITLRFIIKAFSILLVAGIIFYYYINDLKTDKNNLTKIKILTWGTILLVFAVIVAGFFIMGSPKNERLRRFDEEKISRLQQIQWQIIDYWQNKGRLPEKLEDLNDSLGNFLVPLDPETKQAFEYNVLEENSFELCAEFNLNNSQDSEFQSYDYKVKYNFETPWLHESGHYCFHRVIDEELYPPFNSKNLEKTLEENN